MPDQQHQFAVGQTVDLISTIQRWAAKGHYEIISLVPSDSNDPRYRLKSRAEQYERVVPQSDLVLVQDPAKTARDPENDRPRPLRTN